MTRKHQITYLPPTRPAREIAIAARRIGRHSLANYDSTATRPCTANVAPHSPPQADVLDSRPGGQRDAASLEQQHG